MSDRSWGPGKLLCKVTAVAETDSILPRSRVAMEAQNEMLLRQIQTIREEQGHMRNIVLSIQEQIHGMVHQVQEMQNTLHSCQLALAMKLCPDTSKSKERDYEIGHKEIGRGKMSKKERRQLLYVLHLY